MIGMGKRKASDDTKRFADRLREVREARDFATGEDFAERIDVLPATYRAWERGDNEPGIANLIKIQRGLNVSLDYLIAGVVPGVVTSQEFPAATERPAQRRPKRSGKRAS